MSWTNTSVTAIHQCNMLYILLHFVIEILHSFCRLTTVDGKWQKKKRLNLGNDRLRGPRLESARYLSHPGSSCMPYRHSSVIRKKSSGKSRGKCLGSLWFKCSQPEGWWSWEVLKGLHYICVQYDIFTAQWTTTWTVILWLYKWVGNTLRNPLSGEVRNK